jgi:uncharacterized protein YjbI with pentapeptide repeats
MEMAISWDSRAVTIVIIAALVLLAALWWLWWRLPQRQMARLALKIRDPKARADTEDNFRKTIGQALGGAAVLIGAGAAYLQFTQQQQAARDQLQAAHDLLISNQVAKGFEQLASEKVAMRLGGTYGLEGVMNTSTEYHQPVLEALCAFVRDGTIGMIVNDRRPPTDIQAALTVIGRRGDGSGQVDLSSANIPGVNLEGANLAEANLEGANLGAARLENANLTHAILSGVNLAGAYVSYATLDRASLMHANLNSAYLNGAHLLATFLFRASMSGADLDNANLTDAILGGVNLRGATLDHANLSHATLEDADLTGARLWDADLSRANLSRVNLSDAYLAEAKLDNQDQLNDACGKPKVLPPGLTLDKPCPPPAVAPPLNRRTTP